MRVQSGARINLEGTFQSVSSVQFSQFPAETLVDLGDIEPGSGPSRARFSQSGTNLAERMPDTVDQPAMDPANIILRSRKYRPEA